MKTTTPDAPDADLLSDGTLTINAAARLSGISRRCLYGFMERGELPYVKLAGHGRRLIPRRALLHLLAANMVPARK